MEDKFELWEPGKEAINKYLQGFSDGYDGLVITLGDIDSGNLLKIKFNTYFAFRSTNESFRLKSLYERASIRAPFSNGINISINSEFLNWVKAETHGIYNDMPLVHYLICSNDDITDIVSAETPTIERA